MFQLVPGCCPPLGVLYMYMMWQMTKLHILISFIFLLFLLAKDRMNFEMKDESASGGFELITHQSEDIHLIAS